MKKKNKSEIQQMVEIQIIARGIQDENVIKAMLEIPRHLFVPQEYICQSYNDHPVSIGEGQTISQPYIVALMTEILELTGSERVLEIGTGSGYQTAILSKLAKEVYTIERIENLSKKAQKVLSSSGFTNIYYKISDGTLGWNEFAPYDRILVTAASKDIPEPFIKQLTVKGKIVIPIGDRFSQILTVIQKLDNNKTVEKEICGCVFVPLIGKHGW